LRAKQTGTSPVYLSQQRCPVAQWREGISKALPLRLLRLMTKHHLRGLLPLATLADLTPGAVPYTIGIETSNEKLSPRTETTAVVGGGSPGLSNRNMA
jgi:hypothetical protein